MFASEVQPAFRGASYTDDAQMISDWDGTPLPFDPADILVWRLHRVGPRGRVGFGYVYGPDWDYGSAQAPSPLVLCGDLIVLTLGSGLSISPIGTVTWFVSAGQTRCLRDPEYRMTLDLTRLGETARILDTILPVMD